jgi:uncharacterized membrane protein
MVQWHGHGSWLNASVRTEGLAQIKKLRIIRTGLFVCMITHCMILYKAPIAIALFGVGTHHTYHCYPLANLSLLNRNSLTHRFT